MTLIRSRYLMLGQQVYRDPSGTPTRMAYSARRAKLFALDLDTAAKLTGGDVNSIADNELQRLADLQAVVDDADDELGSVLDGYRDRSADPGRRAFGILATSYCNMACDYCGQEHFKSQVSQDRMNRLAERVEATIADPATSQVGVAWFGGEPLMALRVIKELSARFVSAAEVARKGYSATMATNGSLLTKRTLAILHDECKLSSMDVTIDGPEELHDQRRIKRNGIGSFHRTIAVLGEAVRERTVPDLRINIRVNVDSRNKGAVADLIIDLACFGFASPQVKLQFMPVHSWGNDISQIELEARRYAQLEAEWLRLAQSLGIGFLCLPTVAKHTTCKATSPYREIIDTGGRVYSCSEHPLVPVVRDTGIVATLSDLSGSAARPRGMFDDWYDQVGDGNQQCGRCPLLPVCGGSCPKSWREGNLPCPSMKFNWEERMDIAALRLGYQPAESS